MQCTPCVLWWVARVETGDPDGSCPRRCRTVRQRRRWRERPERRSATWRDVTRRVTREYAYPAATCMNPEKAGEGWPVRPRLGFGDPACSWQFDDSLRSGRDQDGATGVLTLAEGRPVSWTSPPPVGEPTIMSREFYVPCTPYVYQVRQLFLLPRNCVSRSCRICVKFSTVTVSLVSVFDAKIQIYFRPFLLEISKRPGCVNKLFF